jgi:hypothetical protein
MFQFKPNDPHTNVYKIKCLTGLRFYQNKSVEILIFKQDMIVLLIQRHITTDINGCGI